MHGYAAVQVHAAASMQLIPMCMESQVARHSQDSLCVYQCKLAMNVAGLQWQLQFNIVRALDIYALLEAFLKHGGDLELLMFLEH